MTIRRNPSPATPGRRGLPCPVPYGYIPVRVPHPVPVKASQGRTKTRLGIDPQHAPVVAQIYRWRVEDHLGIPTITSLLNACTY
jgi:site-specific DNA recombinase